MRPGGIAARRLDGGGPVMARAGQIFSHRPHRVQVSGMMTGRGVRMRRAMRDTAAGMAVMRGPVGGK
jgi:hypothetical protein